MADDRIPMTRDGYDRLKHDLDQMATVQMMEITQRVATAREMGDLSENAEYHAAREDQGILQAKVNELRDRLSRAYIVDRSKMPEGTVAFGATVKVKDLDYNEEETYTLVGAGDDDVDNNKILTTSPIGQGLMGKKVGDTAEIAVPRGKLRYEVLDISY